MIKFFEKIKERIDCIKKLSELKKQLLKECNPSNYQHVTTEKFQAKFNVYISQKKLEGNRIALEEYMLSYFGQQTEKTKLFMKYAPSYANLTARNFYTGSLYIMQQINPGFKIKKVTNPSEMNLMNLFIDFF